MKSKLSDLQQKANLLRKWCLEATTAAGSGHPTTCLSAADLSAVLFDKFFKEHDRFVLSKGHAAPLLYAIYAMAGAFPKEKLLTLRKFDSDLEGHPTPSFPYAEAATGSLGQGLSVGCGIALVLHNNPTSNPGLSPQIQTGIVGSELPKIYVLLGDGEMAEGSVWEAINFASFYKLNNLIAIVDVNGLGQSGPTMFKHDLSQYGNRFVAAGWDIIEIDGHNFDEIEAAFAKAQKATKPFAIIAKTKKGRGVSLLEDKEGWHGKPLKKEELAKALEELGEVDENLRFASFKAKPVAVSFARPRLAKGQGEALRISYKAGDMVATREAYGAALVRLGALSKDIYALDGDVKNSTFAEKFKDAYPDRFIECFIAEQNMVGVALGLSTQGRIPFVSTFACFLTRASDQIRMSAISRANIKFVGSHAGVSIGEDGPSQMGLEDIAMFGAIPKSVILHPSDAASTAKLIPEMVAHRGITYLRTLRPKTPILYDAKEAFPIGGSKVLRSSEEDALTVVAAGITVHEALKAYEILKEQGILVCVVDCYSIKPIDKKTLQQCSNATKKKIIITIEDHYEHGGLGDFILDALATSDVNVVKLAVREIPRSGTPAELLDFAGISAKHIVEKVKGLL